MRGKKPRSKGIGSPSLRHESLSSVTVMEVDTDGDCPDGPAMLGAIVRRALAKKAEVYCTILLLAHERSPQASFKVLSTQYAPH